MRLQPEHILTFAELVRRGSVGAAAAARHLTQPAVSNQLRQLQQAIGEPLYRRQGRGVALTAAGEAFHVHALRVEQALRAAQAFAEGLAGGDTGRVRIAASQTIAGSLLPAFLAAFQHRHAGIEVLVDTSNSRQVVARLHEYDIGLVESPLARELPADYRAVALGRDEVVLVMPRGHALAALEAVPLRLLAEAPLIWREAGSGTNEVVEQAFREIGLSPERRLALGGVAAVLEALRPGPGPGLAHRLALRPAGALATSRPVSPGVRRPSHTLMPPHRAVGRRPAADAAGAPSAVQRG